MDAENYLSALVPSLEAVRRGHLPTVDDDSFRCALDTLLLAAPRLHTWPEFVGLIGHSEDRARRIWRAIGFPRASDDVLFFTDADVEAAQLMTRLTDMGVLSEEDTEAVARAIAQSMSRLAEWQIEMLRRLFAEQKRDIPAAKALDLVATAVPLLERAQSYLWRRHLDAAVWRSVVRPERTADVHDLSVGFADMVGFALTTRQSSSAELSHLVERFEASTASVIADHNGRVVKTVGDEVLFVADNEVTAAHIALDIRASVEVEPALPDLRIGLAAGPVLVRFGDVYGDAVNIAARLTDRAPPNEVIVDHRIASALRADSSFSVEALGEEVVSGCGSVEMWRLNYAQRSDGSTR